MEGIRCQNCQNLTAELVEIGIVTVFYCKKCQERTRAVDK